ncbi:MAG TPA: hypothetical protein PLK82_02130, partial [Bacteroidales bacterium]|nr:hypothetical protein [Bacteroidales bacterium]
MKKLQMVDLHSQYLDIKEEIDRGIHEVVDSCAFINGPAVLNFQKNLEQYLGVRRYIDDQVSKKAVVGVATGLAWTEVGGELLQIEVQTIPGKG